MYQVKICFQYLSEKLRKKINFCNIIITLCCGLDNARVCMSTEQLFE